jgi:putative MATE family efflux protein
MKRIITFGLIMEMHQHRFIKVFWPLLIEIFLSVLVSLSDTLMLYGIGQTAVAGVGSAITYLNFINVAFIVFSAGMLAVFTQYVGANQAEVVKKAARISIVINSLIAVVVMITIYLFLNEFIHFVIPDKEIADLATQYGLIVGASSIFIAINPIIGNYMRAYGHDKSPMVATIIANIINITLNYLAIFVFDWGVAGVAWATFLSHVGSFVAHLILAYFHMPKEIEKTKVKAMKIISDALEIGLPAAFEGFAFLGAMSVIITILNILDPSGVETSVRVTIEHIARMAFVPAAALAHASAIKTGFYVGASNFKKAQSRIFKISGIGISISLALGLLIALIPEGIIDIFTSVENIDPSELAHHVELIKTVLWLNIGVEAARTLNIILGESLKTTGDAWFLGTISLFSLMFFAIGGSILFGFIFENGVIGIFVALMIDETFKGIVFFWRWMTRRWTSRSLVMPIPLT